jgi:hypothetical protein
VIWGNDLGVALHHTLEFADVWDVVVLRLQLPERHFGAHVLGHGVQLFVCRIHADDMVARADEGVEEQEVGADGALCDDDVLKG